MRAAAALDARDGRGGQPDSRQLRRRAPVQLPLAEAALAAESDRTHRPSGGDPVIFTTLRHRRARQSGSGRPARSELRARPCAPSPPVFAPPSGPASPLQQPYSHVYVVPQPVNLCWAAQASASESTAQARKPARIIQVPTAASAYWARPEPTKAARWLGTPGALLLAHADRVLRAISIGLPTIARKLGPMLGFWFAGAQTAAERARSPSAASIHDAPAACHLVLSRWRTRTRTTRGDRSPRQAAAVPSRGPFAWRPAKLAACTTGHCKEATEPRLGSKEGLHICDPQALPAFWAGGCAGRAAP